MATELAQAFSSDVLDGESIFTCICGVFKLGDFASDVLFLSALSKYDRAFPDAVDQYGDSLNILACKVVVIIFTLVGLLFDFSKFHAFLKHKKEENDMTWGEALKTSIIPQCIGAKQDEENGREKSYVEHPDEKPSWVYINFVFEEIPQFLVLMVVLGYAFDNECDTFLEDDDTLLQDRQDRCTDEQVEISNQLVQDGMISMIFTCFTLVRAIIFYARKFHVCPKKHPGVVATHQSYGKHQAASIQGSLPNPHENNATIVCDICHAEGSRTSHYKCATCPNFDMCPACHAAGNHAHHKLVSFQSTTSPMATTGRHIIRVYCDVCNTAGTRASHYKCSTCPGYDICRACHAAGHHCHHSFVQMAPRAAKPTVKANQQDAPLPPPLQMDHTDATDDYDV